MLPQRDQHYGPLLHGLIKNGPIKIGKASPKAGHLRVGEQRLLAKYSSAPSSAWSFTFRPEDVRTLATDHASVGLFGSYVCLVCGLDAICVLRSDEVFDLLSAAKISKTQTIQVQKSAGCCLRVSSSETQSEHVIPANRFPSDLS
jgi:hypothetical protein